MSGTHSSRGVTLIASLLLLMVLSGIAIGMIYMTSTELRVGGTDMESNLAYYGSEAGMEEMTADLANLYSTKQAPTVSDITALQSNKPTLPGIGYTEYTFAVPSGGGGMPAAAVQNISSGPYAGLVAQVVPMTLQVTAQRPLGTQARLTRQVEVAMIPVFQFGVFCETDCSYFPGPSFDFAGRVHTNGNLFLAESDSNGLIFHSKISAVKEVIRAKLSNGVDTSTTGRTGPIYVPNAASGCDTSHPGTNCIDLQENQGSRVAGPGSAVNSSWVSTSTGTYNSWIVNGTTGATKLQLPLVSSGVSPIEIIREPAAGESASSALGQSRLFNQAQIRVLLADTAAELHPLGGATDSNDVNLANVAPFATGVPVAGANPTYFAEAKQIKDADWVLPPGVSSGSSWPLLNGWLRVEVHKSDGTFLPVTQEWLKLGFARGLLPPDPALGLTNGVHPNAILILQMQADRDLDGDLTDSNETTTVTGSTVKNNWYPINLYDTREGEVRDTALGTTSCAVGGVINVLELDVNNLRKWVTGTIGTNGTQTETTTQDGYVLYFSDRRGMGTNPAGQKVGEYGFEDIINPNSSAGTPNGVLDPPEDVNGNGTLETYGGADLGDAFGVANNDPTIRLGNCTTSGRKNRVSGARHALKLVDGASGNLPSAGGSGGFTVASENPVYVYGDYNSSSAGFGGTHVAAGIIADGVTLLSNSWTDAESFQFPTDPGSRDATDTWYRVAIAAGKNLSFTQPTWSTVEDFGTDGGVHNFLRYLEDWGGQTFTTRVHWSACTIHSRQSEYTSAAVPCTLRQPVLIRLIQTSWIRRNYRQVHRRFWM